jgi:alpha-galactosidase
MDTTRKRAFLLIILSLCLGCSGRAETAHLQEWSSKAFQASPGGISNSQGMTGSGNPGDALLSDKIPPFSFIYGGKSSAVLLPTWKQAVGVSLKNTQVVRWTDPATGLEVKATATSYDDFPAVEWVLNFTNTGKQDTPILEDIQALDEALDMGGASQNLTLRQIAGSNASQNDFVPSERKLSAGTSFDFAPSGGRSSDSVFPFFNLQSDNGGVIVAIGWSGQWKAQLQRDQSGQTQVKAGMELTHLLLHPGETIRTPSILLLRWSDGDWIDAQNQFRRLLLAHYVPRLNHKPVQCCIGIQGFNCWSSGGASPQWCTEAGQIASAKINAEIGCDTLWMDAGWFDGEFPNGVGNWTVKQQAFPHGLKPIADACHALGLKWLVWWEPERAAGGTRIQKEHPEFLLGNLFNLGDPAALAWMTDMLNRQINEFGVDCYRNDFNMAPLSNWRNNDAPDRQGMTEIRYIEGLYSLWDSIRARHPNLWIDDCASGGRRIDLEMLKRAVVQTRSDSVGNPNRTADWEQSQSYGLALYVPEQATFGWSIEDTYYVRSCATNGWLGDLDLLNPAFSSELEKAKIAIKEIRENQRYWYGDFYPLTPWTMALDQWIAYQLNCPETNDGIVLAFRHGATIRGSLTVALRGIKPDLTYKVTFSDNNRNETSQSMSGKDLAHLELKILEPRSSLLVRYKAIP